MAEEHRNRVTTVFRKVGECSRAVHAQWPASLYSSSPGQVPQPQKIGHAGHRRSRRGEKTSKCSLGLLREEDRLLVKNVCEPMPRKTNVRPQDPRRGLEVVPCNKEKHNDLCTPSPLSHLPLQDDDEISVPLV